MIAVSFTIKPAKLAQVLNFERTVKEYIPRLTMWKTGEKDPKGDIIYEAQTDFPTDLLLLGGAILSYHEVTGHCND